jgi:hypothetical protein
MPGSTRDPKRYGDRLVYEALLSKWSCYHARCRCGGNWTTRHAEPAGFTLVRKGSGFIALAGPGLIGDVDEARLTTNAVWEAVTGEKGAQSWFEPVKVIERSEKVEAERKAANDRVYGQRRERAAATNTEPLSQRRRVLADGHGHHHARTSPARGISVSAPMWVDLRRGAPAGAPFG